MDKIKRLSVCVVYFSVVFSVILGIITRSSYKDINPYDVPLHTHIIDCCDSVIKDLSISKMQNKLKRMKNVFIVTVNEKEFVYRSIKSIMTVEEVIKGGKELEGKKISMYEVSFIDYNKDIKQFLYRIMNNISIGMQQGKRYLVFADKVSYAEKYEKTLPYNEFIIDWDYYMYYFPIDEKIIPLDYKDNLTYADVKNYDYLCFTKESANKLEKIKLEVLNKYLHK